jgi:hypothetical protein
MIDTFHQTSVCRVSCLKHFGTCDVEMLRGDCVPDLPQYPRVSDVQVVLQGRDEIVHREVTIGTAVCIAGTRLRTCQYLLAARALASVNRGRIAPHRLVITSTSFQSVAVTDVILILLFEFVVAHRSKCCPPKDQSLIDIQPDSLHKIRQSASIKGLDKTFRNKPYCKRP